MRKKLTAEFYVDEFWSPDNHIAIMDAEFMLKLQRLRSIVDQPFRITSGYRTIEYNARVGGASNSLHLVGKAADIDHMNWDGATKLKFVGTAIIIGFAVGVYRKHFHIDTRLGPKVLWIGDNVC
jgi:uncharacterized protein YcbK (DUF882 family)